MAKPGNVIKPPNKKELFTIRLMIFIGCFSVLNFLYWFFQDEYKSDSPLYWILAITLVYGILRTLYMWYHYWSLSVPDTPETDKKFEVDILTTYFPGEPYEMIVNTLEAIQAITYPHTTYLCDEANDPYLIDVCKKLGVVHVTRDNRINAKAGNINNALKQATGEICVILDPDHIPFPNFLDPIIPHFADPEIGFVQIVQSYYNIQQTLVARGAAEQTFQFYGPMMMTMNTYGTVNAIGANCTFRRAALDSIGGHAPGLSEDMHTAMLLHAKGWKSVYVPEVLARGLAPTSLLAFYKQQLKWARGTFDLLFYVYPGLFRKFTNRQKVHYGLLPLHYLIGAIYLMSFLIPILCLFLSTTPWTGNIVFFGIILLPLSMSTVLIRAYIQKWVMEEKERGFHIVGGLLQITTWWIYFIGFIYTIIRKKIPYLPTPKEDEEESNLRIIIPNIIIGIISLAAVVYGLSRDFTPFSVAMAVFALVNAFFMFFSVYLATRTTNKNKILRTVLEKRTVARLVRIKGIYRNFSKFMFRIIRPIALPLVGIMLYFGLSLQERFFENKWENIKAPQTESMFNQYLGVFYPGQDNGQSDLKRVKALESSAGIEFDIVSLYIPWGDSSEIIDPRPSLEAIYEQDKIPLLTWEPWLTTFKSFKDSTGADDAVYKQIRSGALDTYIEDFALTLKSFNRPVFLRFAHEFDNPFYPWYVNDQAGERDFKEAWKYLHQKFEALQVDKVVWVWNPWKHEKIKDFYPGDDYVDWIGVTGLNYGLLNTNGKWVEFADLYRPFHDALERHRDKPVMVAEFGTLKQGGDPGEWVRKALASINKEFRQVHSVVLFNSGLDKNVPESAKDTSSHILDWTIADGKDLRLFSGYYPEYLNNKAPLNIGKNSPYPAYEPIPLPEQPIRGVGYKKGQNWLTNNYVLSREVVEEDFQKMKDLGINLIRFESEDIYDQNVINISGEFDMAVQYSFWIPHTVDFIENTTEIQKIRNRILKKIGALEGAKHILAWNLGNDTWKNLEKTFNEPVLSYQRAAYLDWFSGLCREIKKQDPDRLLLADIEAGTKLTSRIEQINQLKLPLDAIGLIIKDSLAIANIPDSLATAYLINDVAVSDYLQHSDKLETPHRVLRNWQDQWESHKISLDGLLDFKGRKKESFTRLAGIWKNSEHVKSLPEINLLLPAVPISAHRDYTYHALISREDSWRYPRRAIGEHLDWFLIKSDAYGNQLAIKELGQGISKSVKIPEDYDRYELMLTYSEGDRVTYILSQLNTPFLPLATSGD